MVDYIAYHLIGRLLPDWMSIRHYCMKKLKTVWSHIRENMSLCDEERSFFIMRSMYQLFMVCLPCIYFAYHVTVY